MKLKDFKKSWKAICKEEIKIYETCLQKVRKNKIDEVEDFLVPYSEVAEQNYVMLLNQLKELEE